MTILRIYEGQALRATLNQITAPVQITYFALDQPELDTMTAVSDLAALTPYLSYRVEAAPTAIADRVVVQGGQGGTLTFIGAPIGTELAALVAAIVVTGRGQSGLMALTQQQLSGLNKNVRIEVFTSPT